MKVKWHSDCSGASDGEYVLALVHPPLIRREPPYSNESVHLPKWWIARPQYHYDIKHMKKSLR